MSNAVRDCAEVVERQERERVQRTIMAWIDMSRQRAAIHLRYRRRRWEFLAERLAALALDLRGARCEVFDA